MPITEFGRFGIWWSGSWSGSWRGEALAAADVAREMEGLGYGALWSSGRFEPGLLPLFGELLAATERVTVASGILSVFVNEPAAVAAEIDALGDRRERFLLGIGASHAPLVESTGQRYDRPLGKVADFLDALDALDAGAAAVPPVPPERRMLAALGPKMLRLAAERSLGAHPYFVPVEHTERAREMLGEGPTLATEVAVVLEPDAGAARAAARSYTTGYLSLTNYANNLIDIGWPVDDLQGGGSDRLVDAVVPHGDAATVARRLREHLDAGADHVCIQVVRDHGHGFPLVEYRQLAAELF